MSVLTSRQKEIAALAALGLSNGEIAIALRVTPETVRDELEAFYRALADDDLDRGRAGSTHVTPIDAGPQKPGVTPDAGS